MNEKNILTLDLAKLTGWSIQKRSGRISSGTVNFSYPKGEMVDYLFVKWHDWLDCTIDVHHIEYVAYELLSFMPRSKHWRYMYNGMTAILRERCKRLNIPCHGYSERDIKEAATGKTTATKPQMIASARLQWPDQSIIDDNQADALWLLYLAATKLDCAVEKHHGELF